MKRSGLQLWKVLTQDAANRVTSAQLGNGLTDTQTYNKYTGRMDTGMVKTATDAVRLQESYEYDALGNVMERKQLWDTEFYIENFTYDDLNRLRTSTVQGFSAKSFDYDAAGNLKTKTDAGTYTYPAQGPSAIRPHAVQSVNGIQAGAAFTYDDNGNLLTGRSTTGTRTISWMSFDMPKTISGATSSSTFAYGPEHQRARQLRSDGATTIYAGAQEVETKAGITTVKTYWPGGVGLEIDKTGQSGSQLRWTHADRLGSPVSITDETGNLVEKLGYDAWGKRRNTNGNGTPDTLDGVVDNRGFTNHEMLDQLDLVHMNGRVYDPWTGRFLSGDPIIQDPMNGQGYSRYSYVYNNPTNLTDPTGFCAEGNEGIGSRLCGNVATNAFGGGFNGYAAQFMNVLGAQYKTAVTQIKQYIGEQKSKEGFDKQDIKSRDATPAASRGGNASIAAPPPTAAVNAPGGKYAEPTWGEVGGGLAIGAATAVTAYGVVELGAAGAWVASEWATVGPVASYLSQPLLYNGAALGGVGFVAEASSGMMSPGTAPLAATGAQSLGSALNRTISFSEKQLQKKFSSHASDFGITRTWGRGAAEEFQGALNAHILDPGTRAIFGTYRGTQEVTHFFNSQTGLNVMRDADGAFLSGWRLSSDQAKYLLLHGNVQ